MPWLYTFSSMISWDSLFDTKLKICKIKNIFLHKTWKPLHHQSSHLSTQPIKIQNFWIDLLFRFSYMRHFIALLMPEQIKQLGKLNKNLSKLVHILKYQLKYEMTWTAHKTFPPSIPHSNYTTLSRFINANCSTNKSLSLASKQFFNG